MSVALISAVDPYPTDAGKKVVLAGFVEYFASRFGRDDVHYIRVGGPPAGEFPVCLHVVPGPTRADLMRALTTRVSTGRASLQEAFLRSPATAAAIDEVLADIGPALRVYDTVRMAQYADDQTAAQHICYLDDLFSDRYDRMLEAAKRYRDVDINPLGNFAAHIPRRLRPIADNRLGQSMLLRMERSLVRRSEIRTAQRFRRSLLVNGEEAAALRARSALPESRVMSVPPLLATPPAAERRFSGQPEYVFLGLLSLPHNDDGLRWFLEAVWPLLLDHKPDARLRVIGREIRPGLRELAESRAPAVTVEGYVDDLGEALSTAAALINPLRFGSGIKLKVIEALSRHLPVVSTPVGAEGIASGSGTGVLVADDPAGLVGHLVQLTEPAYNLAVSADAGGHFSRVYSRAAVSAAYDAAFTIP